MADLTLNIISNMSGATAQVNEFTNAMKRATSAVSSTGAAVKKTGSAVSTAAAHVAKLGHSANKTAGFFGKLNKSLARIAVYRTMRKAISYVGEAFKTGLEAAYQFSKANQPAEYAKLAGAMDGIKKAASTMSLQLGAAFGGLITAIAPVLIRIINLVTAAADAITRFFAVLNGTGYYKKAAEGFEEVGNSAGGAGKKIKGLLASWDELNVIGKESGGGGGGSNSTDYSGMYEWADAESDWASLFASGDFFGIGSKIGDALGNISKKITEFLKKPEIQNFGKNLADTLNGLVSDPKNWENFGETVGTFIGTLGNIVNDFIANTNWGDVKTALVAFWEGLKDAFHETYNGVDLFGAINILINGWLADLPAKAKNAGIKFTNALIKEVENGLNDLIRIYNESFGWLLGNIEPVHFNLIPEVPEEELNKNYNSAKKTIEELFKNNPAKAKATTEVTEPKQKLGPEKFFSHGKVVGEGYAYEIVPQLKEKLNISDWLSGNGSGKNDGVTSTGNGLALTLSVIASLGDRSNLINGMNKYVVRKDNPWSAYVNPIYNTYKSFKEKMTQYVTGVIWKALVNPVYNTGKSFYDNIKKYITGRIWQALVNPTYNTGKTFFDNLTKYVTGKIWKAPVNPTYNTGKQFNADMRKYITDKIAKKFVNPTYGTGKGFNADLKTYITDKIALKKVNPTYGSGKQFNADLRAYVTDKIASKKVNPVYGSSKSFNDALYTNVTKDSANKKVNPYYNSDKDFFDKFSEKITGVTSTTKVNPVLKITNGYKRAVSDATAEKELKVTATLDNPKGIRDSLSKALKGASATLKTTINGVTTTVGNVVAAASGGIFDVPGQLFIAREAGPELVGTMGGNTAVANNDQIVSGIQYGVAQANSEQNELLRQQNSILMQLLNKDLTISPSVALGQVMARSAALYGRA